MTAAQLEANRRNAQKSTGPVTEQGKAISSQNACRHNLTGGPALAPGEAPAAYEHHLQTIFNEYKPATEAAKFVVRQIADAMWRLARCQRFEDELLTLSANPFLDDEDVMRRFDRLERYRQAIERTYQRFVKAWQAVSKDQAVIVKQQSTTKRSQVFAELLAPISSRPLLPVRANRKE